MRCTLGLVVACLVLVPLVACQQTNGSPVIQPPAAPSSMSATSPERPWKASLGWAVTRLEWPEGAAPFSGVTSLFGGRCSAPSDYVIYATFDGEATHTGKVAGEGSHCSQLHLGPMGPTNVTYSDGRGTLLTSNGSTLEVRWGNGTSWVEGGVTLFKDRFTVVGGTGIFTGATGGGEEGGSFTDFMALINGTPARMWQEGTITYGPGNR